MVARASSWGTTPELAFPKHSHVCDVELQQKTEENPLQEAEVWSSQGG